MTWQPAPSIPLASQPSSWRRPVSCPSIPISFSVCLVFSLLALCPAGLSWQVLKILLRARTTSVCVVLLLSRGLRWAQWLAEFCFAHLRWRCGLCRWCRGAFWGISSPWPVILLSVSAVSVQDSQAYRNMDMTALICVKYRAALASIFNGLDGTRPITAAALYDTVTKVGCRVIKLVLAQCELSLYYISFCYKTYQIGDEDGILVGHGSCKTTVSAARQRMLENKMTLMRRGFLLRKISWNGRRGQNVVHLRQSNEV